MAPFANISRYWHTLRWLKPVQFYGRLWFRLARPRPDVRPAPRPRQGSGAWVLPAERSPSLTGPGAFLLLNQSGDLAVCGWDDPARDKLWRYNQHYFDDLNAQDAIARTDWHGQLLDHWINHNPPGRGSGWEPYPTSLRIINWIKWALAGNTLADHQRLSLTVQIRWLSLRLEWHLQGNHLLANAKALVFAGLWFEGYEAQAWLDEGLRILTAQIPEQILPDGGQFELSPMYHALALEDVLDLVNVGRRYERNLTPKQAAPFLQLAERVELMRGWLAALSHPDGRIAFFNDAAFSISPERSELEAYAERLGFKATPSAQSWTWLPESGLARLAYPAAVLIADMAQVGPDYLPGHAHADSLSFELSVHGQRLFVNSGVSEYGAGPERLRQRGTAAHNTMLVKQGDSSDVWSGFRVGQRARPYDRAVSANGRALVARAAHDGYRALPGRPVHRRQWTLLPDQVRIRDEISAAGLAAEIRFHLHPGVKTDLCSDWNGTFTLAGGQTLAWSAHGATARLEAASWHPEFGASLSSNCLVLAPLAQQVELQVVWS